MSPNLMSPNQRRQLRLRRCRRLPNPRLQRPSRQARFPPADATALRDRVRAAGFSAFTESVTTDKGSLTRVRVGPVATRAEADALKLQVKAKVGVDGIVRPHP